MNANLFASRTLVLLAALHLNRVAVSTLSCTSNADVLRCKLARTLGFRLNCYNFIRYMHALTGGKAAWFDSYLGALEKRARDAGNPVHLVINDVDSAVVNIYGVYLIIQEGLTAAAEM
jgi:hypothetical protein